LTFTSSNSVLHQLAVPSYEGDNSSHHAKRERRRGRRQKL
jgi:hypothetical protein